MKANRKAIDSSNFWDGHWVHGRYTAKPKINASEVRRLHKLKKLRLRAEQRTINCWRAVRCPAHQHRDKQQKKHNQIQYGFNIANWWGEQHA